MPDPNIRLRDRGDGWICIARDERIATWAEAAYSVALDSVVGSAEAWRCGGTWFVGVDALQNGPDGRVGEVAFPWDALPLDPCPLHKAQLSVIRPGYPAASPDETEAAYRYRLQRDAAHLDGMLAIGPTKARMIREPHDWILGIPLNLTSADASPLVVWEGSHEIMREALTEVLSPHPPEIWGSIDVTAAYKAARQTVSDLPSDRVGGPARRGHADPPPLPSWRGPLGPCCQSTAGGPDDRLSAPATPIGAGMVVETLTAPPKAGF
jgi:hypothetical protein